MRSAFLRGREHTELGFVAVEAEGPAAIAISRGGAPKVYAHTDPNEDAALFAHGPGGTLLAVADAHDGFAAAEVALDHLLAHPAAQWTSREPTDPERWERHALAALVDANAAILREARHSSAPRTCTTLSLAVVRPGEGRWLYATIGDSHLFRATMDGVSDRGIRALPRSRSRLASCFLGWGDETAASLAEKCLIGVESLTHVRAVLLVTDGLSERQIGVDEPEVAVARCVDHASREATDLRPRRAARGLVETALEAHGRHGCGDNVASAVIWLE